MPGHETDLSAPVVAKPPRRRRCKNCGAFFRPGRKWQQFCRERVPDDPDYCRREYHRHGSAFGPMREQLLKHFGKLIDELVEERVGKRLEAIEAQLLTKVDLAVLERRVSRYLTREDLGGAAAVSLIRDALAVRRAASAKAAIEETSHSAENSFCECGRVKIPGQSFCRSCYRPRPD